MTAKAFRCPSCGYLALESEGCRYCNPIAKEANTTKPETDNNDTVQEGTESARKELQDPESARQGNLFPEGGLA